MSIGAMVVNQCVLVNRAGFYLTALNFAIHILRMRIFLRKKEKGQGKSQFIIGFEIVTKKESVTNSCAAKTENSRSISRHWLCSQSIL